MSDIPPLAPLERRYRQLMRVYPSAYRRTREDEIVGVLLACAAPGQTRPTAAERWDVVRGGLRAWWVATPSGPVSSRWLDVASVVAVVLPLMFALNAIIGIGDVIANWITYPMLERSLPARSILVGLVGWTIVSVNILRQRWRGASYAAIVTALVSVGFDYRAHLVLDPEAVVSQRLMALLPAAVLYGFVVMLLCRAGTGARGLALLGRPLLVVTAAALTFGSSTLVTKISDDFAPGSVPGPLFRAGITWAAIAFALATIAMLLRRRRAATTIAVVAVALVALVAPVAYFARLHWLADPVIAPCVQALAIVAVPIGVAVLASLGGHPQALADEPGFPETSPS